MFVYMFFSDDYTVKPVLSDHIKQLGYSSGFSDRWLFIAA